jgi:urease
VGELAQKRLARGVKLNHTEATALIASQLLEFMRDGVYSVAQLMDMGKQMLGRRHVMAEVLDILDEVQVEGTFPDGTYLVTVHDPICTDNGNLELALYGSFLPLPSQDAFVMPPANRTKRDAPGAIIALPGTIELNSGRKRISLTVTNHADRAVQVRLGR